MSMFDKYENNSYTPYNLTTPSIERGVLTNFKTPLYTLDKQGNVNRFYWVEGERFSLNLRPVQKVRVPKGSLILHESGKAPSYTTEGTVGMKCYNVVDCISWTCVDDSLDILDIIGTEKDSYIWRQDDLFECLEKGGEEIKLTPFLKDNIFKVEILNFRHEVIYEYESDSEVVSIEINEEETPLLVQGQYYIRLFMSGEKYTTFIKSFNVTILGSIDRLAQTICTDNYYITSNYFDGIKDKPEWDKISPEGQFAEWTDVNSSGESNIYWEHIDGDVDVDTDKFIFTWSYIG